MPIADIKLMLARQVDRITYDNFKNAVGDDALHNAYLKCWQALADVQNAPPSASASRNGRSDIAAPGRCRSAKTTSAFALSRTGGCLRWLPLDHPGDQSRRGEQLTDDDLGFPAKRSRLAYPLVSVPTLTVFQQRENTPDMDDRLSMRRFGWGAAPSFYAALVVGTILNVINQGDAIFGIGSINWLKVLLTYFVPYAVCTYGAVSAQVKQIKPGTTGEAAP